MCFIIFFFSSLLNRKIRQYLKIYQYKRTLDVVLQNLFLNILSWFQLTADVFIYIYIKKEEIITVSKINFL